MEEQKLHIDPTQDIQKIYDVMLESMTYAEKKQIEDIVRGLTAIPKVRGFGRLGAIEFVVKVALFGL